MASGRWPRRLVASPECAGTSTTSRALGFLSGLLTVLRDCGHPGLLLVLDEIETLQRVRGDVREKGLNALRQLLDELDAGRFPGLFLVITGTPAFFDGRQGVQRLPPLAQRLATDLSTDPRFDSPRAVQLRLPGFDLDRLGELGRAVRDLYAARPATPTAWPRPRRRRLHRRAGTGAHRRARRQGRHRAAHLPPQARRRTCSTGSTSMPTSTPARTTRSRLRPSELTDVERSAVAPATAGEIELDL